MSSMPLADNGFDYSAMPTDDAQAAFTAAARIKYRISRTALDIIEIGRDLIEVKRVIGHGNFLNWIDAEFGMSRQSADRFMQAAEAFPDSKVLTVGNLPPTVLYALAAPSTSDEVRGEIVDRAERGEKVVVADVKELKAKLAEKDDKLRTLRTQKQSADINNSRLIDDIRSKTNECQRLGETIENLKEEIRRLNEPGTITVTPQAVGNDLAEIEDDAPFSTAQTMIDLYDALSPDLQTEFHKLRPAVSALLPPPSSQAIEAQRKAAEKIVGLLLLNYGRAAISDLNKLWTAAGPRSVQRELGG